MPTRLHHTLERLQYLFLDLEVYQFAREAKRRTLQSERTRHKWSNPLSIYTPDTRLLRAVEFSAGLAERSRDFQRSIANARSDIELLKSLTVEQNR